MAKTLCDWKREELARQPKKLARIVSEPRFYCCKCARVSNEKKYLCKARAFSLSELPATSFTSS